MTESQQATPLYVVKIALTCIHDPAGRVIYLYQGVKIPAFVHPAELKRLIAENFVEQVDSETYAAAPVEIRNTDGNDSAGKRSGELLDMDEDEDDDGNDYRFTRMGQESNKASQFGGNRYVDLDPYGLNPLSDDMKQASASFEVALTHSPCPRMFSGGSADLPYFS